MTTLTNTTTVRQGPSVLKPRQLQALLAAPDKRTRRGRRDAALCAVLAGGGLRLSECCHLTVEGIELGPRLRLTFKSAKSQGKRWRTVTLPNRCAKLLKGWLDYSQPKLFVFEGRRHEPLSTRQAHRIVSGYLREIGCGWASPHTLRHSYATALVHQSHDIWLVQKQLGHTDPRITSKFYAHADTTDSDRAASHLEEML